MHKKALNISFAEGGGVIRFMAALSVFCFAVAASAASEPVRVTAILDTNQIALGQTTFLHVFAEIAPEAKAGTSQIFSWYTDLTNDTPLLATADYGALRRPSSDNDAQTSSSGITEGANRLGIFDTFLNRGGAGRDAPVELFSVPITAVAEGRATFRVAPGSGVSDLSADFIVAPEGGGDPLTGADYTDAFASLQISGSRLNPVSLKIAAARLTGAQTSVTISFPVQSLADFYVESTDSINQTPIWKVLPGAPHNSGTVRETNSLPYRFYRLRLVPH